MENLDKLYIRALAAARKVRTDCGMTPSRERIGRIYAETAAPAGGWRSHVSGSNRAYLDGVEERLKSRKVKYIRTRDEIHSMASEDTMSEISESAHLALLAAERNAKHEAAEAAAKKTGVRESELRRPTIKGKVSDLTQKSQRYYDSADWKWARKHFKPSDLYIEVAVWPSMHAGRDRLLTKIFLPDQEKQANAYAKEMIKSGRAVSSDVDKKVKFVYSESQREHVIEEQSFHKPET